MEKTNSDFVLFNKTKNKKIIENVKFANNSFLRFKGLMFESKDNFDYALVFDFPNETKIGASLHMMFVFFPIDVLFLNSEKQVIDKTTMTPWQFNYTPKKPAKYVVEMPKGKENVVLIGDYLKW